MSQRCIVLANFHRTLYLLVLCCISSVYCSSKLENAISIENQLPGTREWWLPKEIEINDNRTRILGFSTKMSAVPGSLIEFKADNAQLNFTLRIYRLGYYNGLGGRFITELRKTSSEGMQPPCKMLLPRLVDCSDWKAIAKWTVPTGAVSGVYVAVPFIAEEIRGSYIPFVILQNPKHARGSDILFKTSDLTWVAYNTYGGWNVYTSTSDPTHTFGSRASSASYNRPFTNRLKVTQGGKHQNFLFGTEYAALRWLEKNGYDVSYAACSDIEDFHTQGLLSVNSKFRVLLSVGHDEYWTGAMRKAYEDARNAGISLVFWSGNEMFWRVRWEPDSDRRIVIARKETIEGEEIRSGETAEQWTGTFIDSRFRSADSQSSLSGQRFAVNGLRHDAITVSSADAQMRFWRNSSIALLTGSQHYETARGLLGYEWDEFPREDCSRPAGLVGLSSSGVPIHRQLMENYGASYNGSGFAIHRLSLYRHEGMNGSTALVFGAGTIQWSWGLSSWHDGASINNVNSPIDNNLAQASVNMFADMGVQPATIRAPLVRQGPPSDSDRPTSRILHPLAGRIVDMRKHGLKISGSAVDYSGSVAGVEVSIDGGVTWRIANGTRNWVYHHRYKGRSDEESFFRAFCNDSRTGSHAWPLPTAAVHSNASLVGTPTRLQEKKHAFRYMVTIVSRAFDDSGWVESIDSKHFRPPKLVMANRSTSHSVRSWPVSSARKENVVEIEILVSTNL